MAESEKKVKWLHKEGKHKATRIDTLESSRWHDSREKCLNELYRKRRAQ
tara:strand:+ start:509 stop:655 length:147 start_codon:yes stop_codon:yes gene_type:complete